MALPTATGRSLAAQRQRLLCQIATALDRPMTLLALVWLGLFVLDRARGPGGGPTVLRNCLWAAFVLQFAVEFLVAPAKGRYLRAHRTTALAALFPALRLLRVFRARRAARARGIGPAGRLAALNRGLAAARKALRRQGFGYALLATALVIFGGAGGMYALERPAAAREAGDEDAPGSGGLNSYGEAVWWTAMTMTTVGADSAPKTPEGRLLGWALAVYALVVFGYITATLAALFLGGERSEGVAAGGEADAGLRAEVAALRAELAALAAELRAARPGGAAPAGV